MSDKKYQFGLFSFLLESDAVTTPTAKALNSRLEEKNGLPVFFDEYAFSVLKAVTNLLLNQTQNEMRVDIAAFIDDRLSKGVTDGWRYDKMPQDGEMYLKGLKGIDETSILMFNQIFIKLMEQQQIQVLTAVQNEYAGGAAWHEICPRRFFEELLAEATEIFYAHPAGQQEIGYLGMADAYGWDRVGVNQMELPINKK